MRRNQHGIALVTALVILAVITLLVLGTIFTTQIESWTTRNDATSTEAYYVAQAGLEKYKTVAFQTFRFYLDHLQQYGNSLGTSAICGNLLASGLDLDRDFTFDTSKGDVLPGGSIQGTYGGGTYTITFAPNGSDVVLTSVGRIHGAKATVQVVFHPQNAGLFSNALFAGGGVSSKFINGGAGVWGSVYVEGPTPSSGTPPTVISTNGNFSMHNYYDNSDLLNLMGNRFTTQQLQDMLGATATDQKDLCARLRVNYGQISAGGSTVIGDATAPTGYKSSLSGLNVYRGSQDISISGSTSVFADNYPNGNLGYDLSKPIELPTLDGTHCKSDSTLTWRECMANDPETANFPTDASNNSQCNLSSIASGNTLTFGTTAIDCSWTPAGGSPHGFTYEQDSSGNWDLKVYGIVDFQGYDLHFARNVATRFKGKATIMASKDSNGNGGDITIDGDVLPSTDQVCDPGTNLNCHTPSFPSDEVLGMIAENDLTFTGANQNQLSTGTQTSVGLFYAGNVASIEKGGVVMGTVIGNAISTSSGNAGQTSKIFQVPGLEYNLAPGFNQIPNDLVATFHILSYERR